MNIPPATAFKIQSSFHSVHFAAIVQRVQRFPRAVTKMETIRKALENVYEAMTEIQAEGESSEKYTAECFDCKLFDAQVSDIFWQSYHIYIWGYLKIGMLETYSFWLKTNIFEHRYFETL